MKLFRMTLLALLSTCSAHSQNQVYLDTFPDGTAPPTEDILASEEAEPAMAAAAEDPLILQNRDIGAVAVAGSASTDPSGTHTVRGSGADIWANADEFHYLHISATGNIDMIARVTGVQFTDSWAKAGLMVRETLDANARNFMVFVTPAQHSGIQYRTTPGGTSSYVSGGTAPTPQWLRVVRTGGTLTGYRSIDGVNWMLIGSITLALPSTVYVGMAVTSHQDGTLCTATFDNATVAVDPGGGGGSGVPAAPSNVQAVTYDVPLTVGIYWTDNATNETNYRIERSRDGSTYNTIATLPANTNGYEDTNVVHATRYWYRIIASNTVGDSPPDSVAITTPSSPGSTGWQHQDIGAVRAAGSFAQSGTTFTIRGSGADIWGNADEFHFAYQNAPLDVEIVARITRVDNTNPWAKAGVMIRGNMPSESAPNVMLALTPSHGLAFQWRSTPAGASSYINAGPATAPVWVRLVKIGSTFTAYRSSDGLIWTQVGTAQVSLSSSAAGLAVTSHNDGVLATGTFDNVAIIDRGPGGGSTIAPAAPSNLTATPVTVGSGGQQIRLAWTDNSTNEAGFVVQRSTNGTSFTQIAFVPTPQASMSDSSIAPNTRYWYRVAATNSAGLSPWSNIAEASTPGGGGGTLPPPWQGQNVGNVGVAGSASYNQGTFTVRGSGADIWETSDAFYYVYQEISGNGELTARLTGLQNTDPWAKAGLMFRQVLDSNRMNVANAKHAYVMLTPAHGTGFEARTVTGGTTSYVAGPSSTTPVWLRLRRQGTAITGYMSTDGVNWRVVATQNVTFDGPVVAGMAVTSHNNGVINTSTFDNVTFTPF